MRRFVFVGLAACSVQTPQDLPGTEVSSATYALKWDATGLQRDGSLTLTTDLGYEVQLTRGYAVTYSVSLAPCPQTSTAWTPLGPVTTAVAGHGELADPSTLPAALVEDVVGLADQTVGPVTFEAARYCNVHVLLARADDDTTAMPSDVDMDRTSLHLEGQWRKGGAWTPFELHTAVNWGVLLPLEDVAQGTLSAEVLVEVTRSPARWFDGLDLATLDANAVARGVVERTLTTASVSVRTAPGG